METETRILIVDDDPFYAKVVREWLRERYRVFAVTSGQQALTFLSKKQVDLLLLDYQMPEMDGQRVLERLRENPATSALTVVFLTGADVAVSDDAWEPSEEMKALRPAGCLSKSIGREELLRRVAEFLPK